MTCRPLVSQKWDLNSVSVSLNPLCITLWWKSLIISLVLWWLHGNHADNFAVSEGEELQSLPLHLKIPFMSLLIIHVKVLPGSFNIRQMTIIWLGLLNSPYPSTGYCFDLYFIPQAYWQLMPNEFSVVRIETIFHVGEEFLLWPTMTIFKIPSQTGET